MYAGQPPGSGGSGGSGDGLPDVFIFGPEVGDETLPPVDDGSSPEIRLNTSFVFFGYNYTSLFVSREDCLPCLQDSYAAVNICLCKPKRHVV